MLTCAGLPHASNLYAGPTLLSPSLTCCVHQGCTSRLSRLAASTHVRLALGCPPSGSALPLHWGPPSPMQLTPSCKPPKDVGCYTMLSFYNQARPIWGLISRAPHTGRSSRLILRMRSGTRGLGAITCWYGGGDLLQTKDQAIIHWPYNEPVTPTIKGSSPSPQ